MRYKYSIQHHPPLLKWAENHTKNAFNNISYPFLQPITTEVTSCFVVGCGHSGTTLVAEKMGKNPQSFLVNRETDIFSPPAGLQHAKAAVREWLFFTKFNDKSLLIEKTPKHIHTVNRIRKVLPNSYIVALTRNPLDTIASLYRRFGDLDFSTERWLIDNEAVVKNKGKASDFLPMKYEELTATPAARFQEIFSFIKIPWDPEILKEGRSSFNKGTKMKDIEFSNMRVQQVEAAIRPNNGKWSKVFSDDQAKSVFRKTESLAQELGYDLEFYESIGFISERFKSIV